MEVAKYKIKSTYKVSETQEFSMDWSGYNFLIIYGHHINGWFISIPNWEVCTEAGEPNDNFYNTEKLSRVIDIENAPCVIAKAIKKHWNDLPLNTFVRHAEDTVLEELTQENLMHQGKELRENGKAVRHSRRPR